jgi:hypothetical protein
MATDFDEDACLEAIKALERITTHEELPGDITIVHNALETLAKRDPLLAQLHAHNEALLKLVNESPINPSKMLLKTVQKENKRALENLEKERERYLEDRLAILKEEAGPVAPKAR